MFQDFYFKSSHSFERFQIYFFELILFYWHLFKMVLFLWLFWDTECHTIVKLFIVNYAPLKAEIFPEWKTNNFCARPRFVKLCIATFMTVADNLWSRTAAGKSLLSTNINSTIRFPSGFNYELLFKCRDFTALSRRLLIYIRRERGLISWTIFFINIFLNRFFHSL